MRQRICAATQMTNGLRIIEGLAVELDTRERAPLHNESAEKLFLSSDHAIFSTTHFYSLVSEVFDCQSQ